MSARLPDEAEHHAEPKAGTLADFLGGEEWIEDLLQIGSGNTGSGVAYRDHDVTSRDDFVVGAGVFLVEIDVPCLENDLAAAGHGVACVQGQVEARGG